MRALLLSVVLLSVMSSSALAHIDLLSPTARYPRGNNKACPCGRGDSSRLCDVPGDRSDPDRAVPARITTFARGSTIKMRFDEYIGHSGRFRVAIDYDGADMADFNQNILLDIVDPSGGTGNIGPGGIWEIEVPLPDMTCTNCTLQFIQMMDGNTADPVLDPIGRSTYYTCADIVLVDELQPIADAGPDQPQADASDNADAMAASSGSGNASGSGCQVGGSLPAWWSLLGLLALIFRFRRRQSAY